jgi:hypothetical protein
VRCIINKLYIKKKAKQSKIKEKNKARGVSVLLRNKKYLILNKNQKDIDSCEDLYESWTLRYSLARKAQAHRIYELRKGHT